MNLTEFIRKHDIRCKDGEEFCRSPEFFRIRDFERTCHVVRDVPFLEPDACRVRAFDVVLKGSVLAQNAISTAVTQKLLEHSSPDLTNKLYTNVDPVFRHAVAQIPAGDWL
jgi:hypothetical protein